MGVGETQVDVKRKTSVFPQEIQGVEAPVAEVFHEGQHVRIRIRRRLDERTAMIPLRNGFPLYATDRAAQCFSVLDSCGRRVASAIRLRDFGLHLVFDKPASSGDYFILTQTPMGRA